MIVVKSFKDLQDSNYIYHAGDSFPRKGYKPTAERVNYLLGQNVKGNVYIKDDAAEPKVETKVETKVEPKDEPKVEAPKITKSRIFTMKASDLRTLAGENGLENADDYTGTELKKWLIDKLGL